LAGDQGIHSYSKVLGHAGVPCLPSIVSLIFPDKVRVHEHPTLSFFKVFRQRPGTYPSRRKLFSLPGSDIAGSSTQPRNNNKDWDFVGLVGMQD